MSLSSYALGKLDIILQPFDISSDALISTPGNQEMLEGMSILKNFEVAEKKVILSNRAIITENRIM